MENIRFLDTTQVNVQQIKIIHQSKNMIADFIKRILFCKQADV